ncbi:unnamed protein product, partial [marine sediment metagenome]
MSNTIFNFKSMIIGHRGTKGKVMENTLESILYAIDLGVDGVEFDIQKCYTGEIVIFHDDTLDRLAFKDKFYFDKTKDKSISKLQWYHLYNTELIDALGRKYKIPKLIDILRHPKVYSSDILINIEIKDKTSHENLTTILMDLIDEGLYEPGRFMISSYHIEPLIYLKEFKDECFQKDQKYQNMKIGAIFAREYLHGKSLLNSVKMCSKVVTHVVLESILVNNRNINQINKLGLG